MTSANSDKAHNSTLARLQALQNQRLAEIEQISKRYGFVAISRGILFVAAVSALVAGVRDFYGVSTFWFIVSGILAVCFFVAASVHETYERRRLTLRLLHQFCLQSIARIGRRWEQLPSSRVTAPHDRLAVSHDLDLFGATSLYQLLETVELPNGKETLRQWIAYGSDPATIARRQVAVAELSGEFDWIEIFHLRCRLLSASPTGPNALINWCKSGKPFSFGPFLRWVGYASIVAVTVALIGFATGWINPIIAGCIVLGVPAVNFLLSVIFVGSIHEIFSGISSRHREVENYRTIFSLIASHKSNSDYLAHLQARMVSGEHDARKHLSSLGILVWAANLRRHGILFLIYLFLQFYFLWDAHALGWLERWRNKNARYVSDWFDALGDWEATVALALLKTFNPDWVFPTVKERLDPPKLTSKQLGHPFIPKEIRTCNDVEIGPPGKVLLVTGSNMSGKSTLLRSVGLNTVLAQAGSVVCASELTICPMWIESSMRIHDSLTDGVSFFMAELKRLKQIVDTADHYQNRSDTLLYLLDEILQGTNSRERHIAVNRVVRHMIAAGAIGAVSTHDLELANAEGLEKASDVVHFREQFSEANGKKQMTFDYIMRKGIAPTTNALKLLDLVGLADKEPTGVRTKE
jgi:uncharacterized membrane protein HdeD (DUF308 family)